MSLREWSGGLLGVITVGWALLLTALFWGDTLRELWRAKAEDTTVFVVVHAFVWILYFVLLIGPPALLTLAWWRARGP
jgi:hypothetical protein